MTQPSFIFTVKQLTRYIKTLLERDRGLQTVWVRGEVGDLTRHSSGHVYFSLKDDVVRLRCAMFRSAAQTLSFRPAEGMTVLARGRISLYEPMGQYQLVVEELSPEGLGALHLAFEALKRKLAAEGLFESERKRPLPRYPRRIALLTSADGAALHDIVTVIRRRWPTVDLVVIPTPVQGANAWIGVVHSFDLLGEYAARHMVDLAVLTRGGGSQADLATFNAEEIARAIVACPVPVVTAIGHEVDFTIADFVSDLRAPTPSAAGELIVPDRSETASHLAHVRARMIAGLERRLEGARRELSLLMQQRSYRVPQEIVTMRAQRLDEALALLRAATSARAESARHAVERARARLEALSPLAVLRRGYAVMRRCDDGRVVRSADELAVGESARVDLAEGRVFVGVERVEPV